MLQRMLNENGLNSTLSDLQSASFESFLNHEKEWYLTRATKSNNKRYLFSSFWHKVIFYHYALKIINSTQILNTLVITCNGLKCLQRDVTINCWTKFRLCLIINDNKFWEAIQHFSHEDQFRVKFCYPIIPKNCQK